MLSLLLPLMLVTSAPADAPATQDSFQQECPRDVSYPDLFPPSEDLAHVKRDIAAAFHDLGLQADWSGAVGSAFSEAVPADTVRLKRLANVVIPSLRKYPEGWFKTVGLERIVLVKDLMVIGQRRKAMPDPDSNSIYYADNDDLVCTPGMEERVHHEFYHFIEAKLNGSMYYEDPNWAKLNPQAFHYGDGGSSVYNNPNWQNLGHPDSAFVSSYSELALIEDKAEVFGWLMARAYSARFAAWGTIDPELKVKRQYLIDFLERESGGSLNKAFFDALQKSIAARSGYQTPCPNSDQRRIWLRRGISALRG